MASATVARPCPSWQPFVNGPQVRRRPADERLMNPPRSAPVLAGSGRVALPLAPGASPAARAVLQRAYAPRQLSLPLQPRA